MTLHLIRDEDTILGRYDNGRAARDHSAREARAAAEEFRRHVDIQRKRARLLIGIGAALFAFLASGWWVK